MSKPNMTYCQYENTLSAMRQVLDTENAPEPLRALENIYRRLLLKACVEFAEGCCPELYVEQEDLDSYTELGAEYDYSEKE